MNERRSLIRPPSPVQRLQGLLALVISLLLLLGVPLALLSIWGAPIPAGLPEATTLWRELSSPDDGSLLLNVLGYAAWCGWLVFAVSFSMEAAVMMRGTTKRVVAAYSPRGASRRLLASIGLLLFPLAGSPVGSAVALEPVAAQVAVTTDSSAAREGIPPAEQGPPAGRLAGERERTVVTGDTLWTIAAQELGSGDRYPEIYARSRLIEQPDGDRLTDPDHIEPGWRLRVPGREPAEPPSRHLSEADEVNPGPAVVPPTTEDHDGEVDQGPSTSTPIPELAHPQTSPRPRSPQIHPSAQSQSRPTPQAAGSSDARQTSSGETDESPVAGVLMPMGGIGVILGSGIAALLMRRRRAANARREPGTPLPVPAALQAKLEERVHVSDDPMTVEVVDRALRLLAMELSARDRSVPLLHYAELTRTALTLHLASAEELPPPWRQVQGAKTWRVDSSDLDRSVGLDDLGPAPYPMLVSVGFRTDPGQQSHVLLDLESCPALGIDGDVEQVDGMLRALALELCTSTYCDDIRLSAVDGLVGLETATGTGRVTEQDSNSPWQEQFLRRIQTVRQELEESGVNVREARASRTLPQTWTPEAVLCCGPLPQDAKLREVCDGTLPAGVVLGHRHGEWTIELSRAGEATLHPLELRFSAQTLDDESYAAILGLARQNTFDGAAPSSATPLPRDVSQLRLRSGSRLEDVDSAEIRLCLLGAPQLRGAPASIDQGLVGKATEVLAYLSTHPDGSQSQFKQALWRDSGPGFSTTQLALLSRIRRWLGEDQAGSPRLKFDEQSAPRLTLTTDLEEFNSMTAVDLSDADTDDLLRAAGLVRGAPLHDGSPQRYQWAAGLALRLIPRMTDVLYESGTRLLHKGFAEDAVRLARTGLSVDILCQPLWRLLLTATSALTPDLVPSVEEELRSVLVEHDGEFTQQTVELLARLRPAAARRPAEPQVLTQAPIANNRAGQTNAIL